MTSAEIARDRALSSVSSPDWMAKALRKVENLRGFATGEDIRLLIEPSVGAPEHHNAWGALIRMAVTRGLLTPTGRYENMKTEKSHARKTPVYQCKEAGHMTTAEDIMLHLIDPLRRAIGEKRVETEGDKKQERSKAYGEYCGVLSVFDLETIKEARKFYVGCTLKWWPSPAEMSEKCRQIEAAKSIAARPAPPPKTTGTASLADKSMDSDTGRLAASEGWIGELWAFIKTHGRWPEDTETAALKLDSEKNRAAREAMLASGDPAKVNFAEKANANRERLVLLTTPPPPEAAEA